MSYLATVRSAAEEIASIDRDADAIERVLLGMMLSITPEQIRQHSATRKRATMVRAQRLGQRISGRPPFGWSIDPDDPTRLRVDQGEQQIVRAIKRLRYDEHLSLRAIARQLDNEGVPTRSASRWSHQLVKAIVERPAAAAPIDPG